MMAQVASSYAAVLLSLDVPPEAIAETADIFAACPQLADALDNPIVSEAEKFAVIAKLFPPAVHRFLKVVCRNGHIDRIAEIFEAYRVLERQQKQRAFAVLEYVTPLTEAQLAAMKKMVCAKTGKAEAELVLRQNPALLGGFVLRIGDETYDRSMRRAMKELHRNMIRR